MNNTQDIDAIKRVVKSHRVISFQPKDITCGSEKSIRIKNDFHASEAEDVLGFLGIKKNLSDDIFAKPVENWKIIQHALDGVDPDKTVGAIVDAGGRVVNILSSAPEVEAELNYDQRIDALMKAIPNSRTEFTNISWIPETCNVIVNTNRKDIVDCGLDDTWKFGTTTAINYTSQQFGNYYLRLICSNGMTTKEELAYRQVAKGAKIGDQFLNFTSKRDLSNEIKRRVDNLRGTRASFAELLGVASALDGAAQEEFLPAFAQTVEEYKKEGHEILKKKFAKRLKYIYTNENLYDVFNVATNLATHKIERIGNPAAMKLNKVAAEMFTFGPNLKFNILDIYKN